MISIRRPQALTIDLGDAGTFEASGHALPARDGAALVEVLEALSEARTGRQLAEAVDRIAAVLAVYVLDVRDVVEIEAWPESEEDRAALLAQWPAEYLVSFALQWTRGDAPKKPSE